MRILTPSSRSNKPCPAVPGDPDHHPVIGPTAEFPGFLHAPASAGTG
jgi:hypothetical protein